MDDLAIIGSGHAGYTAGIYAGRANLKPVLFEGLESGGQLMLTTDVENYPGFDEGIMGPEMMQVFKKQAERFGTKILTETVNTIEKIEEGFKLTTSKDTYKSWFNQIKSICCLYNLPHPLALMDCPLSKFASKRLFRSHVTNYWETKLRTDTSPLPSLKYFKPQFMSLQRPHPLWTTCGSNSF